MNIIIYLISITLSGLLINFNKYGDISNLSFVLKPVVIIVHNFLGATFKYYDNIGFISRELKINITRDCSGINFLITIFLMLVFSFTPKLRDNLSKLIGLIVFFIASFITTILANSSRIIGAISIEKLPIIFDARYERLVHQSIGVTVYFIYLVLIYFVFTRILVKMGDISE